MGEAGPGRLHEALPVGGDVPGVSHGDEQGVGCVPEGLAELEGSRLLALEAVRVDAVHEGRLALFGKRPHDGKGGVEGAAHRDHARAMGDRLRELAGRDLPRGEDHGARHARACRVRGGRSGRVAGRCAEDHARALFERFRHSDDHSAILE